MLGTSAWAADKVKVGAFQSVSDAALYIALAKGYFAEQNLDVEMSKINSGATMVTQLASEALDVSGGSPGAGVYNAVRQGIPMKIVADKGSTHPGHGYFAFVVRKDLAGQIKSPADFKGRSLAVTGYQRGASSEVTIGKVLAEAGLKESDLKLTNMAFGDILAALGTGRIEIGVLVEPLVTQAVEKDVAVIWKRTDEVYPSQQYGALMYGPGIIKRPDVANRFMVAYLKGVRFYNEALSGKTPSKELVDILTEHTTVKNRALYDKMKFPGLHPDGKLNVEGMRYDVNWWAANGRMKEVVDPDRVVDTSYAEHAVKKLGKSR
ncbi:MAG TPA: ABC transporter substrate-binding protein [Burkholderiales bacterium]|nr:ABC transporter substrate-binding protein [Burkholderiales bacterium]